MTSDIRRFGASEGIGFYWVKVNVQHGRGYCELVAVDEVGTVTQTTGRQDYDETARTREEAALHHLAPAIKEADADLERWRAEAPAEEPPPIDRATSRFLEEDAD